MDHPCSQVNSGDNNTQRKELWHRIRYKTSYRIISFYSKNTQWEPLKQFERLSHCFFKLTYDFFHKKKETIAKPKVKVERRTNLLFSRRQKRILTFIPDQRSPSWVWSSLHRRQCKVRRFLALNTVKSTWNWCLHLYGRSIKIQTSTRNVFDKSFLETICEKSTRSMFNNGQSKHRLVTFKEKNLPTRSIT